MRRISIDRDAIIRRIERSHLSVFVDAVRKVRRIFARDAIIYSRRTYRRVSDSVWTADKRFDRLPCSIDRMGGKKKKKK